MEDTTGQAVRYETPFSSTPAELLTDPKMSARAKALYGLLGTYAGADRSCYPSQARLAEQMGCSRETVVRTIAELKESGWVDVTQRGHTSALYVLRLSPAATSYRSQDVVTDMPQHAASYTSHRTRTTELELLPSEDGSSAQAAVEAFVESAREVGYQPPSAMRARVGKMAKQADADGIAREFIVAAAAEIARRRTFSAWANILADLQTGNRPGRPRAPWADQRKSSLDIKPVYGGDKP